MNKENDLMDSLLREHAKYKGVDEKFLSELEKKLDAEDGKNVVMLDWVADDSSSASNKWKLGLGIGVAACAAICVGGSMLWESNNSPEVIALDNDAAAKQIESAEGYLQGSNRSYAQEPEEMKDKEVVPAEKLEISKTKRDMLAEAPPVAKVPGSHSDQYDLSKGKKKARAYSESEEAELNERSKRAHPSGGSEVKKMATRPKVRPHSQLVDAAGQPDVVRGLALDDSGAEQYGKLIENDFTAPVDKESKRSTFAVDVDTASYANVRRLVTRSRNVPADSVRIEEMVNYFDYQYEKPLQDGPHPFAVHLDAATCPWNEGNKLVRVALQGKEVIREDRPASNVVFLLDVSGSMNQANKLPLLKESLKYLLEEMNEKDTISIVVYAGATGLVLPATKVDDAGRVKIAQTFAKLKEGGSTAGGAGIKLAYKVAQENFIQGGVNRVILGTDGDFNVGATDANALSDLVKEKAEKGVDISVLGFGEGNLNDKMLEMITNNGNGNYSYIDTIKEGRKVLLEDMMGTMVTIAKDVKIQVEFNPHKVKEYRLIGYSNRGLANAAFLDKRVDAGEIGAGHRVTAFYEIVPGKAIDKSELDDLRYAKKRKAQPEVRGKTEHMDELLYVKLAYKQPDQKVNDESTYLAVPLKDKVRAWTRTDDDFKFSSSVALFGMLLRDSDHRGDGNLSMALKLAESGKGADGRGLRGEFINLVKKVKERDAQIRIKE